MRPNRAALPDIDGASVSPYLRRHEIDGEIFAMQLLDDGLLKLDIS